ncbi:MAG: murein L,D-transpeptidase catalytic domain family protein [Elusimicrobia bacterium]|nr:murein L,D-transpeptidase catalytic domain family protein [Elusimicrobiota bacterium]
MDVSHLLLAGVKDNRAFIEETRRFEAIRVAAERAAYKGDTEGLKGALKDVQEFRRRLSEQHGLEPTEQEEAAMLRRFHEFIAGEGRSQVPQRVSVGAGAIQPGPGRISGVPVQPSAGTRPPIPSPQRQPPPARSPWQTAQRTQPPRRPEPERALPPPRRSLPPREQPPREPPDEVPAPATGPSPSGVLAQVAERNPHISRQALTRVSQYLEQNNVRNKRYVAVADYRGPTGRFHLIDMSSGRVQSYAVSRGAGGYSNRHGSHATSLGIYTTAETYSGAHGYSLRVDGRESTNNNARRRLVVIHGADYVGDNYAGRSWGCFALSYRYVRGVIDKLKQGAVLIAHR